MAETFEPLDFIYAGLREHKGSFCMVVIPIRDGEMEDASIFPGKPKRRWAIGGVYRGAMFGAAHAKGLVNANFHERWHDTKAIMEWQAQNDAAESFIRDLKMEADARKRNEIEACLLPLRQQYASMQRRRDSAGLSALENAVLRALRSPVRKNELDQA